MITNRRRLYVSLLLLILAIECRGANASDQWVPTQVLAVVPISIDGGPVLIPVTVGQHQRAFILATGSSHTVVDRSLLEDVRIRESGKGAAVGSALPVKLYKSPGVRIAGINCEWLRRIPALDFTPLRSLARVDCYGMVGMDFLSRVVIHLDFDNHRLFICDSDTSWPPPGKVLPIQLDATSRPRMEVVLGRTISAQFLLDTGCTGTAGVARDLLELLRQAQVATPRGINARHMLAGGQSQMVGLSRVSDIGLGEYHHKDLVVHADHGGDGQGRLGLYYLYRYRVGLNVRLKQAVFSPGKRFSCRDRDDQDGIELDSASGGRETVISKVAKGSIAEHVGLKVGDVIVGINGDEAIAASTPRVKRLLSVPTNDRTMLKIRRGGEVHVITIPGG